MSITIPLVNVREEDVAFVYRLFSDYTQDPTAFKQNYLQTSQSNKDPTVSTVVDPSGECREVSRNLHRVILDDCTCGTCYNLFARADRIPWKSNNDGTFVNSKHGKVEVDRDCPVSQATATGFIFDMSVRNVALSYGSVSYPPSSRMSTQRYESVVPDSAASSVFTHSSASASEPRQETRREAKKAEAKANAEAKLKKLAVEKELHVAANSQGNFPKEAALQAQIVRAEAKGVDVKSIAKTGKRDMTEEEIEVSLKRMERGCSQADYEAQKQKKTSDFEEMAGYERSAWREGLAEGRPVWLEFCSQRRMLVCKELVGEPDYKRVRMDAIKLKKADNTAFNRIIGSQPRNLETTFEKRINAFYHAKTTRCRRPCGEEGLKQSWFGGR